MLYVVYLAYNKYGSDEKSNAAHQLSTSGHSLDEISLTLVRLITDRGLLDAYESIEITKTII